MTFAESREIRKDVDGYRRKGLDQHADVPSRGKGNEANRSTEARNYHVTDGT